MRTHKIIETIGSLAKEEKLITLVDYIMPNSFVLETVEPFPGYHGTNLPVESKPVSVFLITKNKYSTEKIFRIAQKIKRYFNHPFDAAPGKICIQNGTIPCIRIRDLDNYEYIGDLQKCFYSEGIKFAKKRIVRAEGLIQLRKHFKIQEIEDGIYRDLDNPATYYISINYQITWKLFQKITQKIRNNISNANFDAALVAIYSKDILDMIRIYANNISISILKQLSEKYNLEIEKSQ